MAAGAKALEPWTRSQSESMIKFAKTQNQYLPLGGSTEPLVLGQRVIKVWCGVRSTETLVVCTGCIGQIISLKKKEGKINCRNVGI